MTTSSAPEFVYRADVDGLRGLAVLAVVAFHAFPGWLPGGFIGVDCFFVISGYLITRDIRTRWRRKVFSVAGFYRRRVHRLFPALLVVLTSVLLAGEMTLFPSEQRMLLSDIAASTAFVQNVWLWHNAGYFDTQAALRPLLHLWSLAVEEQFYMLWPWLLVLLLPLRAARGLVTATAVLSFFFGLWLLPRDAAGAYYLLPARAWQVLVGATVALAPRGDHRSCCTNATGNIERVLAAAGALTLAAGLMVATPGPTYPGWKALLPTLGTAVLLIEGAPTAFKHHVLGHRWLVGVGLVSYPLYLWHWPLLALIRIYQGGSPSVAGRLAVLGLAGVLAWATWRVVERRLRPIGSGSKTAALVMALLLLGMVALLVAQLRPPDSSVDGVIQAKMNDVGLAGPTPPGAADDCDPHWKRALPKIDHCLQSGPRPSTAVVVGDSHAHHLFPGLRQADPSRGWLVLANNSCPPVVGVQVQSSLIDCGVRAEATLQQVAADPNIDRVLLAFLGSYAMNSNLAAEHVLAGIGPAQVRLTDIQHPGADKPQALYAGLTRAVMLLEAAGKSVVIVIDVPEWPFQPRDCIRRPLIGQRVADCSIPRAAVLERQSTLRTAVADIVAQHPRVQVFDPIDQLCDAQQCTLERQGVLTMRDSHHLSERGSILVARQLVLESARH